MKNTALFALLILAAPGCGSFTINPSGVLPADIVDADAQPIRYDTDGRAYVGSQRVYLDSVHDLNRYGVSAVDTSPLPREWQLAHMKDKGGVMVTRVEAHSPLGIAGLRGYDHIVRVNGRRATIRRLRKAFEEEGRVNLEVVTASERETVKIKAEACDDLNESTKIYVPFVVEGQSESTGSALGLGPFDALFNYRSRVAVVDNDPFEDEREELEELKETLEKSGDDDLEGVKASLAELDAKTQSYMVDRGRHRERFEWGFLANLFYYESETNPKTGESKSRLRLFWFLSLGDMDKEI